MTETSAPQATFTHMKDGTAEIGRPSPGPSARLPKACRIESWPT